MIKEEYNKQKAILKQLLNKELENPNLSQQEVNSLKQVAKILDEYSFENRLKMKGYMSRVIIDSLELGYSIGEEFLKFDNAIS